jgi:SHS2 domain-containing protein
VTLARGLLSAAVRLATALQLQSFVTPSRVLEFRGRDLDALFEAGAAALAGVMLDPAAVPATVERTTALEAESLDVLLHDWLCELLARRQRWGEVYPRVRVAVQSSERPALAATVVGGPADGACVRGEVRGVRAGEVVIEHGPDGWRARVVLDL